MSLTSSAIDKIALEKGLPANIDAERFILGSVLLNDSRFIEIAGAIIQDDFALEKHRRIFSRMMQLHERGEKIDRVTVANELQRFNELQSVDGLTYLVSLDDGLPHISNLDSYVKIVRDKATLRRIILASQHLMNRALLGEEDPGAILAGAEETLLRLGEARTEKGLSTPLEVIQNYQGGLNAFLDPSKRIKGISTGFTKLDEMTGGFHSGELIILAARPSMGKCLAANAEIVTGDGSIRTIGQICSEKKAELLTLQNNGRLSTTSPSAFVDDGIKPVFRVTTRLGRSVDSTLPHPFLTFDGWKRLEELKAGDVVAVPRRIPIFGAGDLSVERAKILGYLLGDGCLTDSTPEFTNSDPRLRDDFVECLEAFGGVGYRIEDSDGTRTPTVCVSADREFVFEERAQFAANLRDALNRLGRSDRSVAVEMGVSPSLLCQWKQARCVPVGDTSARLASTLRVRSDELFRTSPEAASHNAKNSLTIWLESLGLWGRASAHKFVPKAIFRSKKRGVAIFLNRLFATDGWASVLSTGQAQLGFASVSERLARQVQHLLLRFGIVAALKRRAILYQGARRRCWQLDITEAESIRTFASEIGIFGKERALERALLAIGKKTPHSNRDLLPKEVWKEIEAAKGALSWSEVSRKMGIPTPGHNLHVGTRGVSRRRLMKFAEALDSDRLRTLATSDLYWDRIVSIEYLGQQQVYDLTIPETHNFVANDVCVHNTAFALNIAWHVATRLFHPVAVFSLEMSQESLLTRMLCAAARVDSQRFRTGYLNEKERQQLRAAANQMVEAPIYLDDTAGANLMDMHAKLRRLQQSGQKLGLVVVDYLQLMSSKGRSENRNQEVSQLSRGLKLLSKELDCPFLVLSQLSRATETRQGDHRPQLSDLRESGCLAGDARVTVACDGRQVPIRELVGRSDICVWALNEASLKMEPMRIERAFSTGTKPVLRLTTRLGRSIRATANHKFFSWDGWKRLDELAPGDRIALPRRMGSGPTQNMRDCELALLGHLLGDGCTLPRHTIQYTTKDRDLAELVKDLTTETFGDDVNPRIAVERDWFQVYLSSTRHHARGRGSAVADWLRGLGAWGLRAWEKRVPPAVFTQPPEALALFLKHLWATDGCIHMGRSETSIPRIYYATSSRGLAQDVQSLLLRLGINARLTVVPQKGKGRDQYPVQISGKPDLDRFIQLIGAVGQRKVQAMESVSLHLDSVSGNTNRDVLPSSLWNDFAIPAMEAAGITGRELASRLKMAYSGTSLYKQNTSRERAARLAGILGSERLSQLALSDVYWDPILSIAPDGEEETFDLTVPEHHNFVANDLFVHNSIEQDADLVGFIFREEVYKRDREDLHGIAELILAKQRNGPIGTVPLVFLHAQTRFENRAEDLGDAPPD